MPRRRIQHPGLAAIVALECPVTQYLYDAAFLQGLLGREVGQAADAEVVEHGVQACAGMVDGIAAAHVDADAPALALQFPAGVAGLFAQIDAVVITQVLGLSWRSPCGQVLRRCTQ